MKAPWQIRLLGTFSAGQGDLVLTRFATSRVAALLARLALFPQRIHSREELAGVLWPEADVDAGRLNLRVALLSLRRQMEPPGSATGSVLIADRSSIRLNPQACTSDAAQFEAALREADRASDLTKKREALHYALALYEGELLPGFYDEWILEERERLQALHDEAETQCRTLPRPKMPVSPAEEPPGEEPGTEEAFLEKRADAPSSPLIGFPIQFTRFFGRSQEKARLIEMLTDPAVRLVTLLGPGGAGKTRLALETARQAAGHFDGPVCFVPLADLDDGALIGAAIASALRLPAAGDQSPRVQAAAHLAGTSSLLVLDNLEHLGEGGALEIRALLESAPDLTCLVTSRRRLDLEGEREMPLSPLPAPAGAEKPHDLVLYPSVQLFVDRAQAVRPDFQITPNNADAVADVCRSLEGLPLALELAAARISALTPGQMQEQLRARLDFLTSRRRDLPPRHRSLRAALEWSAHLLTSEQGRFFAKLSVFRGGWTLDAAAAVCETSGALAALEQLRERSLITADEASGEMRFRMLESLREFGEEQLTPAEKQALTRRHADYFGQIAEQRARLWYGPQQNQALEALTADYDNLRAALAFCRSDVPDADWDGVDTGLRLAAALGDYWTTRGLMREGMDWLEGALALGGSDAARAGALAQAGWLAAGSSDFERANAALTESIALCQSENDRPALASALRLRGTAFIWKGEFRKAEPDLEEALALSRALGDDRLLAVSLNSLGVLANEWHGDNVQARARYEEALPLLLRLGDQQRASYCLHNLGNIAHDDGDHARAAAMLRHSLELADALGDAWHRAYCLRSLGDVFLAQNDYDEAAHLLEEGCALCRRLGDRMTEAGTRLSLARVRRRQGRFADADTAAQSALRLYQAVNRTEGVTESWMILAETAAAQSNWPKAALLLSAAAACRQEFSNDSERDRYDGLCASARAALGPAAYDTAWQRGPTLICDDYGLR